MRELIAAGGTDPQLGPLRGTDVRRRAIVIGVDTYASPYPSLRDSATDAKAMREVVSKAGFAVTLMTPDSLIQPTRATILRQLERHEELPHLDLPTIYLSGHGESTDREGYFLPMDVAEPLADNGLSVRQLFGRLARTNAEHRFVIVDACRVAPMNDFTTDLSRYSEETNIIFTACDRDQLAPEVTRLEHGLFTYYLLEGLQGAGDRGPAAATSDGTVTVLSLLDYVMRGIEDWQTQASDAPGMPQQITTRVTFSVLPWIGCPMSGSREVATNFSLNTISGHHARVDGFELGVLTNSVDKDVCGANVVGGDVQGYQAAGAANVVRGSMDGFQMAGAVNYAEAGVRSRLQ